MRVHLLAMATLSVLAQQPQATLPTVTQEVAPWLQIGSSLGFAGLVWYLVTVQMPRREKEHADLLREVHKEHASIAGMERETCERRHRELHESIKGVDDSLKGVLQSLRGVVESIGQHHAILREIRHETANLAHVRAMDRAVHEAKIKRESSPGGS